MSSMSDALKASGVQGSERRENSGLRAVCEITNVGEYGFADVTKPIDSSDDGPTVGEHVHIPPQIVWIMQKGQDRKWEVGDQIVLLLKRNGDKRHEEKTPWTADGAIVTDGRCKRVASNPTTVAERKVTDQTTWYRTQVLEIVAEANEAGLTIAELMADAEYAKAYADLKVGMTANDDHKAKSALGRMRAQIPELIAPKLRAQAMAATAAGLDELLGITPATEAVAEAPKPEKKPRASKKTAEKAA